MKNRDYFLILLFFFILFITGMMETIIIGIMPIISEELGISNSLTGQLISVYALTFAFMGPLLVSLVKKKSHKKSILLFLSIFSIGNYMTFISENFELLFLSRIICAIGASVLVAKILESCFILFKDDKKKLALVNMGFSSSIAVGVPLGTYASDILGWREIFLISSIISVLILLCLLLIFPEKISLKKKSNNLEEKYKSVSLTKKIPWTTVKLLLITMLILTANMVYVSYLSPYLHDRYMLPNYLITVALGVLGIGGVFGSGLSAWILERFQIKHSLIVLLSVFSILLVIISLSSSFYVVVVSLFTWSMVQWSTGPIIQFAISSSSLPSIREQLISLNVSFLNIGSGLGGILGGIYISYFPIWALPLFAVVFSIMGLMLSFSLENGVN